MGEMADDFLDGVLKYLDALYEMDWCENASQAEIDEEES